MLAAQNVPLGQILSTLASSAELQATIQELVATGKLSANAILGTITDSQDLRDTVSTSCTKKFSKYIPA
jgi:hypothetical protein